MSCDFIIVNQSANWSTQIGEGGERKKKKELAELECSSLSAIGPPRASIHMIIVIFFIRELPSRLILNEGDEISSMFILLPV